MTQPSAWVTEGARGQYRVMIGHGPLDSCESIEEAEQLLRHYGQSAYRMVTSEGETTVTL